MIPSIPVKLIIYTFLIGLLLAAVVNGINVWNDNHRWCVLAGLFMAAANLEGVDIRWGGDWDGDGNNADSRFNDYPHYELARKDS